MSQRERGEERRRERERERERERIGEREDRRERGRERERTKGRRYKKRNRKREREREFTQMNKIIYLLIENIIKLIHSSILNSQNLHSFTLIFDDTKREREGE